MAINFPNTPSINDTVTVGTTTWTWNGSSWVSNGESYSLPTATTTDLGGVKIDGTTITIDGNGVISSAGSAYSLPTATTTDLGGVKIDGTTITIDVDGVISSTATGDVSKAASSTDNAIIRFDGTTGDTLQNSLVTITDTGVITAPSVGSIIPFYFADQASFPVAGAANHGAIAHSHADERMYFSHNNSWVGIANYGEPNYARSTAAATTTSIADAASADITITNAAKTYSLLKIETSHAAWITLYSDTASRTADASRVETVDPEPGSGVIAEIITNQATTQIITPAVFGWNNETVPVDEVYAKVVNKSGSAATITVTLTLVKLEV